MLSAWVEPLLGSRSVRDPGFINLTICVIIHAFMISYAIFMHIGSTEEITLLKFNEEEEGVQ